MAKLFVGFLLGIAVASAFYFLIDREPLGNRNNLEAQSSDQSSVVTTEPPVAETRIGRVVHRREQEPPTDSVTPEVVADGGQPTSMPESQSDNRAKSPEQPANRTSSNPSAVREDNYPPEIEDMIENRVDPELQARYEGDHREDSWATYMEGQLANYFGSKPELSQFNFSSIDCRTSMCSVHALGYGPQALTQWNMATSDLVPQQWHDFRSMSMNRHNPSPDILAIVLILSRNPNE